MIDPRDRPDLMSAYTDALEESDALRAQLDHEIITTKMRADDNKETEMLIVTTTTVIAVIVFAFLAGFFWTVGAWLASRILSLA